jgi:O-methyltransferase
LPDARGLYLELLKRTLTRLATEDEAWLPEQPPPRRSWPLESERRLAGRDWPVHADTMIGLRRLDQLQTAVETVLIDEVPGDLLEAGVWRGGAAILMRGVLAAHGDTSRTVWLADSFAGLPTPDAVAFPADAGIDMSAGAGFSELVVPVEKVRANFARYGLLDEQVCFLEGWFRDTLPSAPIKQLAVLRLDGDLYESTWIALESLYPKVSRGGYVIIDDYGAMPVCRQAVDEYRRQERIREPLREIDWTGFYWRRA